jgi:hypothetical protein
MIQNPSFIRWHERQLFGSFAWLVSCLLCGFLFFAVIEFVALKSSGIFTIITLLVLYAIGLAAIELFRRFWLNFSFAQHCAGLATCSGCGSYGLFEVRKETWPIYARCQKCGHQWVIGDDD